MAMHSLLRQHGLLHLWRSKQQINLLKSLAGCLYIKSIGCMRRVEVFPTSGHIKYTKGMAMAQESNIQIQIFQPTVPKAIPPAKTVMNENSHSPKAPAAPPR